MNAYPLSWPVGWPRTQHPTASQFDSKRNVGAAYDEVVHQLEMLGARNIVISANLRLRLDGIAIANQSQPDDRGVAVYFKLSGQSRVLACDKWTRVQDNLWSIAKHIDAMRGQQRWGVGTVEQAFAGYAALPEPAKGEPWHEVFGLWPSAPVEAVRDAYRAALQVTHPDKPTGNRAAFDRIQRAWEAFGRERGL